MRQRPLRLVPRGHHAQRQGPPHRLRARQNHRAAPRRRRGRSQAKPAPPITFFPDATIFVDTIEFKFDRLATRLRELAFLNPGLTIDLEDERPESAKKASFFYAKGIEEFVVQLGENKTVIHDEPVILHGKRQIDLDYDGKQTTDDVFADVVFQYNDSYNDQILCFANSIPNGDGGTHLTGFRTALTRAINQYAKANKILKDKDPALTGDDVREGLVCVISVKMPNPRFSSQTKDKLVNTEIEGVVSSIVYEGLMQYFDENPALAKQGHREIRQRRPRPRGRPQGPRDRPQIRPLRRRPARQTRRLLRARSREVRALYCRRRLRRWFRQTRPRPPDPGHPPAARKAHQRREGPPPPRAPEQGNPEP